MPAAALPQEWMQQLVRLRFTEPVPRWFKDEFFRIRLSMDGKASGEGEFHRTEVVQPHAVSSTDCAVCWNPLRRRVQDQHQECANAFCSEYRKVVLTGPTVGIVRVATTLTVNGQVAVDCNLPDGMIHGCILCLDRRYDKRVLDDVYRAAKEVAEQCGFSVV